MQGGDISNETAPRLAVSVDLVAESEVESTRKLLKVTTSRKVTRLRRAELSQLWTLGRKFPLSIELFAFESDGWTQELLDAFVERLDRRGTNPFNYAELYDDITTFIDDLPYRTNLRGVVDLPGRVARYGSWGIEITNL